MIAYVKLTNNASAVRVDATSGDVTLTLSGNYFNGSFGAVSNALTARYAVNDGTSVSVTPTISGNTYTAYISLSGLDYTTSHKIAVTVSDKLASVSKMITVKQGIPVFDWGESDFRFNVPVKIPGKLISWAEIDSTKENGWYVLNDMEQNIDGVVTQNFYMFVAAYDVNWVTQYIYPMVSNRIYELRRTCYGGTWSPLEWKNPPFANAIEYRTTERYANHPVYAKMIYCGTIANGKTVSTGLTAGTHRIIRHAANDVNRSLPRLTESGNAYDCWVTLESAETIAWWCGASYTGDGYVTIWYFKNGEY